MGGLCHFVFSRQKDARRNDATQNVNIHIISVWWTFGQTFTKRPAFCDRDMKRIPSLYMQRTNRHSYVRGESRDIVLFLCTSSDHVLYFKVWPWRSLTDLVITINSAYHLSIRKLQKSFHWWRRYGADTRSKMTDGQTDRQTDRQANRQTDNITINNIILPVLRWTRGISVLWRLFLEVVTRLLWQDHQIWHGH